MTENKPSRRAIVILLVLALLCLWAALAEITNAAGFNNYCNDDAYISFTYARNWIEGHGLVFYPGSYVEGYTNFLWVVFLAPWMKLLPHIDVSRIAIFWGAFFSMTVLVLTYVLGYQERKHHWTNLIAPALLSFDNSFHYWSISGLENAFQASLVLAGLIFLFRGQSKSLWLSGVFFALATMARPDSGLFWAVALAAVLLHSMKNRPDRSFSLRDALRLMGGYLVLLVPWAAWKLFYYGELLPNPFYLHTGNRMLRIPAGSGYFTRFMKNRLYLPLLALGALFRGYSFRRTVLLLSVFSFCFYVVWIGGDFFPGSRFFYVILPLVYLLIEDALAGLAERNITAAAGSMIGCVLMAAILFHSTYGREGEYQGFVLTWAQDDLNRIQLAEELGRIAQPGDSILSGPVGQIAYYSKMKVLDFWGVTDPHIARLRVAATNGIAPAHEKTDLAYLLEQKPRYIIFGVDPKNPPPGYALGEIRGNGRRWLILQRK